MFASSTVVSSNRYQTINNKDTEKDPYTLHMHLGMRAYIHILLTHTLQINCWKAFDALSIKTELVLNNF